MKKFTKIISLLLCISMIFSCQSAFFIAAEGSSELPETLRTGNYLIDEQFTGNTLTSTTASMWSNSFDRTNYTLENDAYTFKGAADSKKTSTLTLGEGYSGVYGFEVDLTHNAEKTLFFEIRGKGGTFISGRLSNKNLRLSGKEPDIYKADVDEAKLKFLFYTQDAKFSAWVGEEQIIDMADAAVSTALTEFYFYFNKSASAASATIDNIKFYKAYALEEDRVEMDKEWLAADKVKNGKITENSFKLPERSEYGSYLRWTSTSDIISIEGAEATVNATDTEIDVILTVQLSADGETWKETDKKELTFTVAALEEDDDDADDDDDVNSDELPEKAGEEDYLINENFEDDEYDIEWTDDATVSENRLELNCLGGETAVTKKTYISLKNTYSGVYALEMDISCADGDKKDAASFQILGSNKDQYVVNSLYNDGKVEIKGEKEYTVDAPKNYKGSRNLKFLFYTEAGAFSAWVDDELVVELEKSRKTVNDLAQIYAYVKTKKTQTATLDNLKFYEAKMLSSVDRTALDMYYFDNVIDESKTLSNDFILPETIYGSEFSWEITEDEYEIANLNGNKLELSREKLNQDAPIKIMVTINQVGYDEKTRNYTLTVAAPDEMPEAETNGEYLIKEHFNNGEVNTTWDPEITADKEKEVLLLTNKEGNGPTTEVEETLYLTQTKLSGVYTLSFELGCTEGQMNFELLGDTASIMEGSFNAKKELRIDGKETKLYNQKIMADTAMLTFLFYTSAGKFSAWLGDQKIISLADTMNIASIQRFYIRLNAKQKNVITMDNIMLYKSKVFDEEVLEADAATLRNELFVADDDGAYKNGQISKDLKGLPERGEYGSYITWETLTPEYISKNGKLLKEAGDSQIEVTLRATIRSSEEESSETITKELTFYIAPQKTDTYSKNCSVPTANSYIVNDSMKRKKFSEQLVVTEGEPKPTENGVLLENGDSFTYLLEKNRKSYNEMLALSLNINGIGTSVDLYDDLDTKVFSFAMKKAGLVIWARSKNERGDEEEFPSMYIIKENITEANITIVADPITGLFSMWYGENELISNARLGMDDCSKIKYMTVLHTGEESALISDFKLYYPTLEAFSALSLDRAELTLESMTWHQETNQEGNPIITGDLKLPAKGRAGSIITWESSNTEVIEVIGEKGVVTQNENEEYSVTMRATFSYNGVDEGLSPVEFDFTVPMGREYEQPEIKKLLYEESFNDNDTSTTWSQTPSVGEIFVKNERLYFKRQTYIKAAVTKAYHYFDESLQSKQGVYGFDCTVLNKKGTLKFKVEGVSDDIIFTNLTINPSQGAGIVTYRDKNGDSNEIQKKIIDCSKRIKLSFLFNTEEETFSLWVNEVLVLQNERTETDSTNAGIRRIYMYIGNNEGTKQEAQIDDMRFYTAYPLMEDRARLDAQWFLENNDRLVNENDPMLRFDMISKNLMLQSRGEYGSYIKWESSNPAIRIEGEEGIVVSSSSQQDVILTAKLSPDGVSYNENDKVELHFSVAPADIANDEEAVKVVRDLLTVQALAPHEDVSDGGVKRSLSLPTEGIYGCSIKWSSDNTYYIDNIGRVTRPRFDEDDVTVTLTATISKGSVTDIVEIPVKVLKDKEFIDPQHMKDSEFFGVWNGSAWDTVGKLDYDSYEGLSAVEEAVKNNNYELAKEELLNYFKDEEGSRDTASFSRPSRNTGWANMITDDFQHLQTTAYYRGSMMMGNEWKHYSTSLQTSNLTQGSQISFSVRAWYNEDSYAEFAKYTADEEKRPVLELTIDGTTHVFRAIDSVTVRAGIYKDTNYSGDEYHKVSNYGDFKGDGLYETYLKFDVNSVSGKAVSSARLVLYGHSSTEEEKRLIVLYHNDNTWKSETLTWGAITQLIYSYNGLGDRGDSDSGLPDSTKFPMERWTTFIEANNSYGQISRFNCISVIAYEYALTKDEKYAYKAMKIMQDFISTTGGFLSNGGSNKARGVFKSVWDNGKGGPLKRGGYDTTLASAIRVKNWLNAMKVLINSEYATPDFLTAALKNIWDTADYLTVYNSQKGNWMNTEMEGLQSIADNVPEFIAQNVWKEEANTFLAIQLFNNTFPDGSYIEGTESYGHGSLKAYITIKRDLMEKGIDVNEICKEYYDEEITNIFGDVIGDESFDDRLKKFALYQILMYSPDGTSIQYGDSGYGTRSANTWDDVYKWFAEEMPDDFSQELKYIATYGNYGTKPSFTSKAFYDSGITTLRGSWSKNSPYLFTNVRGGAAHAHRDYNSITLIGYGNTLIADSGYFEYDSTDEYRQYGVSTEAHNTVTINNTNQISDYDGDNIQKARPYTGTIHSFETNNGFDFLQQSTPNNYDYGTHMRTITYLKPDLFIVSDHMVPNAENIDINNYKQTWHMYPEAYILGETEEERESILNTIDGGTRKIRSNHKTGGNVMIASADVDVKWNEGYCAKLYAKVEDAPYVYYEVEQKGTTNLNTVIMTMPQGRNDDVTVNTLYKTENKSALELIINQNSEKYKGYYFLSYDGTGGEFGRYETDAQMAYVQLSEDGNTLYRIIISGGTYIKDKEKDEIIFKADSNQEQVCVDFSGREMMIEGDADKLLTAKILSYEGMSGLYIGNVSYSYNITDGYVTNIGNGTISGGENITEPEIEGVVGNKPSIDTDKSTDTGSSGGGGGGGGGTGSDKPDTDIDASDDNMQPGSEITDNNTESMQTFSDTKNHWAQLYVEDLRKKGIVNGDENGLFNPNNQITRAEFIAMVIRSMKLGEVQYKAVYSDVRDTDWYAQYVLQALSAGIISKDVFFRPNAPITREEMAKIIAQANKLGVLYTATEEQLKHYADSDSISKWAREYVSLITQSGLMNGRSNGFCPRDNSTRAEAAAVISRMLSK